MTIDKFLSIIRLTPFSSKVVKKGRKQLVEISYQGMIIFYVTIKDGELELNSIHPSSQQYKNYLLQRLPKEEN